MIWENKILVSLVFFAAVSTAHAQVFINEIMFNPSGSDSGHEWIEICASERFEATDNLSFKDKSGNREVLHTLSLTQGDVTLLKDECAIIASDAEQFKSDYPNLSANLLDATPNFSLLNSGESIAILKDGTLLDQVLYDTQNVLEGQSLHRNAQSFVPADPTPGNKSFSASAPMENKDSDTAGTEDEKEQVRNITELPLYKFKVVELEPPQDIFLRVPDEMRVHSHELLGLPVELFDARGREVEGASVSVSWGDFSKPDLGAQDKEFTHIYKKSGAYIILLKAQKQTMRDEKTIKVTVLEPSLDLYFYKKENLLVFENKSKFDINLKDWKLKSKRRSALLSETIIAPDVKLSVLADFILPGLYHAQKIKLISPDEKFEIDAKILNEKESVVARQDKQDKNVDTEKESENAEQPVLTDKGDHRTSDEILTTVTNKEDFKPAKAYTDSSVQNAKNSIFGYSIVSLRDKYESKAVERNLDTDLYAITDEAFESNNFIEDANSSNKAELAALKISTDYRFVFVALSLLAVVLIIYFFYLFKFDEFDDWTFEDGNKK